MKLFHFFSNLSISKKLSIFLLIPFATVFFFASNTIYRHTQSLYSSQDALHFAHIVSQSSDLIYQLQKERGLSAGAVGSDGQGYQDLLAKQRIQTDKASDELNLSFNAFPSYFTEDLVRKLIHLKEELQILATIRIGIDEAEQGDHFEFYSHVITELLAVNSFLPTLNTSHEIHNLALSYLDLLWLEERSGQERGALNGVFSAQEFKADQFSDITSYIAGQKAAIRDFTNVATAEHQQQLTAVLEHPSSAIIENAREVVFNRAERHEALTGLQELIGYGGLIHNFKNYVIRGKTQNLDLFQHNFTSARVQIEAYRHLPAISDEEKEALNIIEAVFKEYQSHLAGIKRMKGQNLSIRYIDEIVKVDDKPALQAINFLRHKINTHDPETWWLNTTTRLDLIHQINVTILQEIVKRVQAIEVRTSHLLIFYTLFTVAVFFLVSFIGLKLRKRLVDEIRYIARSMRQSVQNKSFNTYLKVTGKDELSDMALAFNSLIDERSYNEEKLRLAARVFNETHEGILITDDKGIIIEVNPVFTELTGFESEEVLGKNPSILSSGRHDDQFYRDMWQALSEHKFWQGEVWNRKKSGELYAELITITAIEDENEKLLHYVGIFSDITHSKRQQEKLHLMAHYDVLTQLPNRTLFADRFKQALAHNKRVGLQLAICFVDLDNFKPINDNFGHDIGDKLLVEVANRITSTIRDEDTVSRQGGDEFALLLGEIGSFHQCEQLLERLIKELAAPYLINGVSHAITASCGVTLYPFDESDLDTLLRHADQAMYHSKQMGKNRYSIFSVEQEQEATHKQHLLEEVEQALSNGEMRLYYQPKVNMDTGKVFGAEALIRWAHPDNGLIPPLAFLPTVDGSDVEIQIGDWVVEQALCQMEQWKAQGVELEVSVNITSHHMQSVEFVSKLATALDRHPTVNSNNLQLEILESSALSDIQTISEKIKDCRDKLGIHTALDDFGTGYSSLAHLRNIPASTIKIDQTFIRDVLDDPNDYAIIDGVLGLAGSFNREVIAEGVETTEHGLMLLVMGCYEAQGYGIAKPMPASDFSAWLKAYQPNEAWLASKHKAFTQQESRTALFALVIEQWKKKFISEIHSSPDETENWPIMNAKKCHCGTGILRVKKEQLYDSQWLASFEQTHVNMHDIANLVKSYYQGGDIAKARDELQTLHMVFEKLEALLAQHS